MKQSQPPAARRTRVSKSPRATRSPVQNGPLPVKSMDRAASAFKNFSMSAFPKGSKPAGYVDIADSPAAVHSAQKQIITEELNRLRSVDVPDGGITLALSESAVRKLLPSLNAKASTVELSDVLKVIDQHMRGTEFYANGNPVLNRISLRSRVRELIAAMKPESTAVPQENEAMTDGQAEEAKAAAAPQKAKTASRQRQAKTAPRANSRQQKVPAAGRQQGARK